MTPTDLSTALHRLNDQITQALEQGDRRTLQDIRAIAAWAVDHWPTCPNRALMARAEAVLRFLAADHP